MILFQNETKLSTISIRYRILVNSMDQKTVPNLFERPNDGDGNIRKRAQAVSKTLRKFIEDGIIDDSLKPGQRLPTERELMEMFGGGRNTIRKTLIALENEGKITRQVGSGTYISDDNAAKEEISDSNASSFLSEAVKSAGPVEVMELRKVFEPSAAELASKRASANDVEKIRNAFEMTLKAKNLQEFEDCDDAFHRAIAEACHNSLFDSVHEIISAVRNETEWGIMKKQSLTEAQKDFHSDEHRAILNAILERNSTAARAAMISHLHHVSENLFGTVSR